MANSPKHIPWNFINRWVSMKEKLQWQQRQEGKSTLNFTPAEWLIQCPVAVTAQNCPRATCLTSRYSCAWSNEVMWTPGWVGHFGSSVWCQHCQYSLHQNGVTTKISLPLKRPLDAHHSLRLLRHKTVRHRWLCLFSSFYDWYCPELLELSVFKGRGNGCCYFYILC